MDDELTPEQQFAAESPETVVPRLLMDGLRRDEIIAYLRKFEYGEAAALALIDRCEEDLRRYFGSSETRHQLLKEARKQKLGGFLLILFGVLSGAVYALVPLGLVFVLPLGLLCTGLLLLGRGSARMRLYGRARRLFDAAPAEAPRGEEWRKSAPGPKGVQDVGGPADGIRNRS